MPSIKDQSTVEAVARAFTAKEAAAIEYYCNPASETYNNWCQSYLKGGYRECTGWETNAIRVLHKDYIQAEIGEYRGRNGAEMVHNRNVSLINLDTAFILAQSQKNPTAMIGAEREKNSISNLHSSTVFDGHDKPNELTPDELEVLRADAKRLTALKLRTG